ncbi:MAG: hypothetical protein ACRC57_08745 [Sarcina sp.]
MQKFKEMIVLLLIIFVISLVLNGKTSNAQSNDIPTALYHTENFELLGKDVNIIVNTFSKDTKNLIVDAYLLNTSNSTISSITNLSLIIKDAKNNICFDAFFPVLELKNPINNFSGVRLNLLLPLDNFNEKSFDFSSINYTFNLNYE